MTFYLPVAFRQSMTQIDVFLSCMLQVQTRQCPRCGDDSYHLTSCSLAHSLALEGCNLHEMILGREWYFLIGIPMGHSG